MSSSVIADLLFRTCLQAAKGEEAAKAQWQEAGVQVTQLIPSFEKDGGDKALLSKFEAEYLVA